MRFSAVFKHTVLDNVPGALLLLDPADRHLKCVTIRSMRVPFLPYDGRRERKHHLPTDVLLRQPTTARECPAVTFEACTPNRIVLTPPGVLAKGAYFEVFRQGVAFSERPFGLAMIKRKPIAGLEKSA